MIRHTRFIRRQRQLEPQVGAAEAAGLPARRNQRLLFDVSAADSADSRVQSGNARSIIEVTRRPATRSLESRPPSAAAGHETRPALRSTDPLPAPAPEESPNQADLIAALRQPVLRPTEVARLLKIGRSTVYLMCQRGDLPCVLINRSVRIPTGPLRAWIERHTNHADT